MMDLINGIVVPIQCLGVVCPRLLEANASTGAFLNAHPVQPSSRKPARTHWERSSLGDAKAGTVRWESGLDDGRNG